MTAALLLAAPLALLLLVLTRPQPEPPPRTRTPRPRTPPAPEPALPRRWITSTHESRWHLEKPGHPRPATHCGHHPRGPLHHRFGNHAPTTGRRTTCEACRHAAGLPLDAPRTPAAPHRTGGRHRLHSVDTPAPAIPEPAPEPIAWPTEDPDTPPQPQPAESPLLLAA